MKPRLVSVDGRELESPGAKVAKLVEQVAAAMDFVDSVPVAVAQAALELRRAARRAALEKQLAHAREQAHLGAAACEELYRLRDPSRWVHELGKLDDVTREKVRELVAWRLTWDAALPRYTTDGARYA